MAGFIRIRKLCCCGGSLRGGVICIGIIHLVLAFLEIVVGSNVIMYLTWIGTGDIYGPCEEQLYMPLLRITSYVSGIASMALLYGAVTSKSSLVGLWLAWNIVNPIVQIAEIVFTSVSLASCVYTSASRATIIAILSCSTANLMFLFYFAVVVYSFFKDLQEDSRRSILLPSKNWDEELTPYTRYDPSAATPSNWGSLPSNGPPPPRPPQQKHGIPRPLPQQILTPQNAKDAFKFSKSVIDIARQDD